VVLRHPVARTKMWNFTKGCSPPIVLESRPHLVWPSRSSTVSSPLCRGAPSLVRHRGWWFRQVHRGGSTVPSTPSSLCSTARTASRSRRVSTSTRCSPTSTTPAPPTRVSTRTPSRSSPRSTSLPALATSPASITRRLLSLWAPPTMRDQPHMFAVNYNVLRVQSGMGGLAFSN